MRKQPSIQENEISLVGQSSEAPRLSPAESDSTLGHSVPGADPASHNGDPALPSDIALDALLGHLQTPILRPGFADRVIHSVQPVVRPARTSATTWASTLAAVLALCAGGLLWSPAPRHQDPQELSFGDEASLVAALRSPELSGDDLALVANLGELLEAEIIANHPLWRDDK